MSAHDEEPAPLGRDARRLVEAAGPFEKLPSHKKAAVRGRVLAAVAASAATALASGHAAASASTTAVEAAVTTGQVGGASAGGATAVAGVTAKAAGVSLLVKVGLSVTLATAALGGWMYNRAQNEGKPAAIAPSASAVYTDIDEPTHTAAPEPSIQPTAQPEPTGSVNSGFPQVTSSPGAGQVPAASAAPSSAPVDTLPEETKLISAAHAALSKGDANGAVALLEEHAARFPNGLLAPERRAAKAMALCKLGRAMEGQKEAEAMFGADSKSPLAEKIRRGCAK